MALFSCITTTMHHSASGVYSTLVLPSRRLRSQAEGTTDCEIRTIKDLEPPEMRDYPRECNANAMFNHIPYGRGPKSCHAEPEDLLVDKTTTPA